MKCLITVLLLCLPAAMWAQTNQKNVDFVNKVIAQREQDDQESIDIYLGISKTVSSSKPRFRYLYEDSVGMSPINNLRAAMKNNGRGVFYSFRRDSVIHIDSVGKRSFIAADAAIKLNTLHKWRLESIVSDSMTITEKERKYINSKIDQMQPGHLWGKGFLFNAEIKSSDSIKNAISKVNGDPWHQLRKMGFDKSYSFSVPIFFRNDTYCLFYYGYDCGSLCGYGEVAIYKKVNGKWLHWSKLISWIS